MSNTRPPAVAGMFYPARPDELRLTVESLLAAIPVQDALAPKVLIVPHAGYIYSGSTSAAAYAQLASVRHQIRRVILLGPTHRVAVNGLAVPECTHFATPLGPIELDAAALRLLRDKPYVVSNDRVQAQEHSLEVHLPFLQHVLENFTLVPIAVGQASPEVVAEVLDLLWGGPETLIVISTDLSHFQTYGTAQQVDRNTCQQILALDGTIRPQQACGAFPLNGLLLSLKRRDLQPELIHLCNSGDTAGDKQRVVGYASFAVREKEVPHA